MKTDSKYATEQIQLIDPIAAVNPVMMLCLGFISRDEEPPNSVESRTNCPGFEG